MNSQIIDEAAEWFVTLRDDGGDPAQRARFAEWLLKSPDHVHAYLQLTSIWAESASVDLPLLDAKTLIARARNDSNVVEFERPALVEAPAAAVEETRHARGYWAAASVVAVAILGLLIWTISRPTIYSTGIGEQRSIALSDGSRIELNSRSRLQVRFSKNERAVDLLEGQGLFTVASDPQRPFIVRSGDTHVRAVGTQFDVYRMSTGTVVTVVEGRVEIEMAQLAAGEQAIVAAHEMTRAEKPNIEAATAWTHRQLVFDAATLGTVAAEFNRYNFRRLVIRDAELQAFPISGVFSSSDPSSLVQFLAEQPDMAVEQTDTEVIISRKYR